MRTLLRWLGIGFGSIFILLLIAAGAVWYASARELSRLHPPQPERLATPTPAQLADAPRQLRVLGCISCHGEGLQGRRMFHEAGVATVWAPNLTLVAAQSTDQQLAQGIRQGIGHDGRTLWVMPSGLFSRLSDSEVAALVSAIRALPRGGSATAPVEVGPIGRIGIVTGRFRSAHALIEDFRRRVPIAAGPQHEAGRRLVSIACAECHGPDLGGAAPTPEAVAPDLSRAAAYDPDQFRTLMRTGRPPDGRDLGLMASVARADFSHYTDAEIAQIHGYLQARAQRVPPPDR